MMIPDAFMLLIMVFMHVIADYNLQGILAQLKQISWWKANYPDGDNSNDYVMALFMHSFAWAFLIMLPIVTYMMYLGVFNDTIWVDATCCLFALNLMVHMLVDHAKANCKIFNLVVDQVAHLLQIALTWAALSLTF